MERKEKDKSEEPWVGRRILGVAAAGVGVAAGAFLLLSSIGNSSTDKHDEQVEDDTTAKQRKTMKGPDSGGQHISRDKFEKDTANYFKTGRQKGFRAAVDEFQ